MPNSGDSITDLKDQNNQLQKYVIDKDKQNRRIKTDAKVAQRQVIDQDVQLKELRAQVKTLEHDQNIRINKVQLENEKMREKLELLRTKHTKTVHNLTKAQNAHESKVQKIILTKKKLDSCQIKLAKTDKIIKELRQKNLQIQSNLAAREADFQSKDAKSKKALSLLSAYESEIFTRDSEILKKETQISQLESKLQEQKRMTKKLSDKVKTAVSDEMAGVNKILEEKDDEIKVLKDMVRSTQYQMRTIEADTHQIKRQLDNKSLSPVRK